MDELSFPSLDREERAWLERDFDREEIVRVLKDRRVIKAQASIGILWLFSSDVGVLWNMMWLVFSRNFRIAGILKDP